MPSTAIVFGLKNFCVAAEAKSQDAKQSPLVVRQNMLDDQGVLIYRLVEKKN